MPWGGSVCAGGGAIFEAGALPPYPARAAPGPASEHLPLSPGSAAAGFRLLLSSALHPPGLAGASTKAAGPPARLSFWAGEGSNQGGVAGRGRGGGSLGFVPQRFCSLAQPPGRPHSSPPPPSLLTFCFSRRLLEAERMNRIGYGRNEGGGGCTCLPLSLSRSQPDNARSSHRSVPGEAVSSQSYS